MSDSAILNHDSRTADSAKSDSHGKSSYGRFLAMVGTSTALMFGLMYLNTYALEHVYWSETGPVGRFLRKTTLSENN